MLENPYAAAQAFLVRNELPVSYIDEVVRFIEKNTAKVTIGETNSNQYVDPYTGASRYQASSNSVPTHQPTGTYVDPYTGTSRYTGSGSTSTPTPSKRATDVLPVQTYLTFKQANVAALNKRLFELDDELRAAGGLAMSPEEVQAFKQIIAFLETPQSDLPDSQSILSQEGWDVALLVGVLGRWPEDKRFPSKLSFVWLVFPQLFPYPLFSSFAQPVLDLIRLLAPISPSLSSYRSPSGPNTIPAVILSTIEWPLDGSWTPSKAKETNTMLGFRALANLFSTKNGLAALAEGQTAEKVHSFFPRPWLDVC